MTREEEIRSRMDAYDKTLGKSIDVQLESWRQVNESAVTDLRFMLGVVDKERKENQRLQQSIADWISGEQGRKLRAENQRLRGALQAYENECLCRVTDTRCERCKRACQALEGRTDAVQNHE